jgi:hypothetical protein
VIFLDENKQNGNNVLEKWLNENKENPYPSQDTKTVLATLSGKTVNQVDHWFNKKRQDLKKNNKTIYKHISPDQKKILMSFFESNSNYLGPRSMEVVIERTGLTKRQINNWFSYQRSKKNLL